MTTHLSALKEDIAACSVCSFKYCRSACAVYDVLRSEAVAPSGFNHFALGILQGMTDYTHSAAEVIYKCTDCGACRADGCVAPGYGEPIDTPNVILALRADVVERDLLPDDVRSVLERLRTAHSPHEDSGEVGTAWIPRSLEPGRAVSTYLWAGCSGHRNTDALAATARLLHIAGVEFGTLGAQEGCCGLLAWQLGDRVLAAEQARAAVQSLVEKGVRELIVAESGCYRLFKALAPQAMQVEVPFTVTHLSEYLHRLAESGQLEFTRPVEKVVAYHDAGQLGAQMGVFDAPRALLAHVPGLRVVEMPHNRAQTRGSGQGAGFELLYPETAQQIARRRLEEASRLGAEWLVIACPAEAAHLADMAAAGVGAVQVRELNQVLIDALA
jgi:heterodisulfide reductase subunit D